MLNSRCLRIIKTPRQDKMRPALRLDQGLKEIDSIWVILKESKSWREKKKKRKLDTSRKRYTRRYHKHDNKAFRFP